MSSYQFVIHCRNKMVVNSFYPQNGISYTGKRTFLYWISPQLKTERFLLGFLHMTSWYTAFHIIVLCLCRGNLPVTRFTPQRVSYVEIWCLQLGQAAEATVELPVIWEILTPVWSDVTTMIFSPNLSKLQHPVPELQQLPMLNRRHWRRRAARFVL